MNYRIFFFVLTSLFASTSALAQDSGLYIEPGVTYESADTKIDWPTPFSSSTGTVRGLGLSARLGFHVSDAFFVALDGRYSRPTFKDSSTNVEAPAVAYNFGPVVGMQMPIAGLRVWAQYILDGTMDSEEANNLDYVFKKGSGYRIGAGFHVVMVSINLEYQSLNYDTTVEKAGPFNNVSFDNSDLKTGAWILGVSFPLAL